MQNELDQVDREIKSITQALARAPDDDPNMRLLLTFLASAHNKRFTLREEPDDIHKAIEYRSIALTLTPDDDLNLPHLLSDLGTAHGSRFQRLGVKDDIEKAIEYETLALELIPKDHPDLPRQLANLAVVHKDRFKHSDELSDIEKAIQYASRAVAVAVGAGDHWHSRLPEWLEGLGSAYSCRFQRFGQLNDLEHAIGHHSHALALASDGHPCISKCLDNLAVSHSYRFQRLGELSDLQLAIEYDSRALALTPDSHPTFPACLSNLAASYYARFDRLGELGDLEQAIKHGSRVLALSPDDHPSLPGRLANLASFHSSRFNRLGELRDLEQAIEYESRALVVIPDGHPKLSVCLNNLALAYGARFKFLGELSDLDQAINHESRALALIPSDHPHLLSLLANLGLSYNGRFERLGELNDLERAIEYHSRALDLTPDNHPDLSSRLGHLGVAHAYRFKHLGEPRDLELAVKYNSRALALTPDDHPDFPSCLFNLAQPHRYRFEHLGELSDLEQAIKYQLRALALTPDDHLDLIGYLAELAASHGYRFRLLGELGDLEQAIEYGSCALATFTHDHPQLCVLHFNHALLYIDYYHYSHDPSHLQQSLTLFRSACKSSTGSPRVMFRYAREWTFYASKHSALNSIEGYQAAIDLLPRFIWLGATAQQRYQDLKSVESLAVDSAHAAIVSSDNFLALEWLEHTRCIVWNQKLMLCSPLDQLLTSHRALGTRLQTVASQLHAASSNSRNSQAFSRTITSEQVAQDHHRLAKEYEDLLAQVRVQPGFEDFLRPMKAAALMRAGRNGPVVIINCHDDGCNALLILPSQCTIDHLSLVSFSGKKARDALLAIRSSLRRQGIRERGVRVQQGPGREENFQSVLKMLWSDVVKPIIDFLGLNNQAPADNLPHITWCPTGVASFLPLHAAGDYDQPRSRTFDYAVSSYTPTLSALLGSTPSTLDYNSRVLAISQAVTPGLNPLPGTTMELKHIKSHIEARAQYSELIDAQATPATVLDAMEQHDWVHLACHAQQNVNDPTKSGFFLNGGILDLATINQRSFNKKGLAFLSACQTATGDETLPDEAVHLALGMLMAGYSSVIATMWSVGDSDAPLVADKVYGQLAKQGTLGNGEAGRALHDAVDELRTRVGEKQFGRWVPFIHIGS